MKLSKMSIQRPVTTVMLILIAVLLGTISIRRLPVDLLPQFSLPYAIVMTQYSGAGPHEIETLVTRPLEGAVATVSNAKNITSISSNGSSIVMVEFNDGTDMDMAMLDMREKIDMIKGYLPEDADEPLVLELDPNMMPIMQIGISGNKDLEALTRTVQNNVIGKIEKIEGVASVSLSGGQEKEIRVTLLPDKLKGYNLTPASIAQFLALENLNLPAGEVKQGKRTLTLRSIGEFNNIDEIRNLPITTSGGIIYLRDVAEVEEVYKKMNSYAYINGNPSISLSVQKQSTANTVKVSRAIMEEISQLKEDPDLKDIEIRIIYDSAEFINMSVENVASTAIIGGILAIFILFVFLRNIRSTFIIGLSIPISIIVTFAFMFL